MVRGQGGKKEEGKTSSVGLAGVVGVLNPILSIEIGLRLKFNTKTTLSDRLFTDYAGLLGVSGRCGSVEPKLRQRNRLEVEVQHQDNTL